MRVLAVAALLLMAAVELSAQQPARPPSATPPTPTPPATPGAASRDARDVVTPAQLAAAIDKLGTVEFTDRMAAARTTRRADPAMAVPALLKAVESHPDGFVRFRALVLLSGFNDPRTRDIMRGSLGLRTTGCARSPTPTSSTIRIRPWSRAAGGGSSRIVRVRAAGADARAGGVRHRSEGPRDDGRARDEGAGLLPQRGDRGARRLPATYALAPITEVAKIDGPLQVDAAIALGKIGDKSSIATLAALQRSAPRESQPAIAAAICLLGVNCESHQPYLDRHAPLRDRHHRLPGAGARIGRRPGVAGRLGARGGRGGADSAGRPDARSGARRRSPSPSARVALRNTPLMLKVSSATGSWSRRPICCARRSTCSKRTSRKSASSSRSARRTGRRRRDPPRSWPTL